MNSKTQSFIANSDKPNISVPGYNQKYENNTCALAPKSYTANNSDQTCKFCQKSGHKIHHCPDFQALSADKRFEFVKGVSLHNNCLRSDHKYSNCMSKHLCFTCKRKHHTMLYLSARPNKLMVDTISSKTTDSACMVPSSSTETPPQEICNTVSTNAIVVLGTTLVSLTSPKGHKFICRAVLDSASSSSFITTHIADCLKLKRNYANLPYVAEFFQHK